METIDRALAAADRAWRAYGIGSADRAALAADVRQDLQAAAADGIGPEQLLGADVAGFARRLADEAGVPRQPPELRRLLGTALLGAALGSVLAYVLMTFTVPLLNLQSPPGVPVQVAVGAYYSLPAALVVAGAVVAVRRGLRDLARIQRTARMMILLLPVAGLLVTPVTMAFAWTTDYSTWFPVVLVEVAMVLAALAGATVLARRWALREPRQVPDPTPADAASVNSV